nr:MAG TPA: hypothetical protein [Caudoviricetes sp.]
MFRSTICLDYPPLRISTGWIFEIQMLIEKNAKCL